MLLHITSVSDSDSARGGGSGGGISPTSVSAPLEDENNELNSIVTDLMDYNAFTWVEGEEQLMDDNTMEVVETVDDDNGDDDNIDNDDGDGTDGITNLMGELSIGCFFDNFESNIEWGGYDYDVEHDIVDEEAGSNGDERAGDAIMME